MRKLLGLIGLMGLMGFLPIEPILSINPVHAQETIDRRTNSVLFNADGHILFIDNEYFGDRVSGYTLPGFVLQPKVEWILNQNVTLKGGFHWLYYWGAHDYPATAAYETYPFYDSVSHPLHLLPWLQAKIHFNNHLELSLGCINAGHYLPLPLYNPELALVGDPETGAQIVWDTKWTVGEVWVDWREYIWNRSPVPERFTAGFSGGLRDTHNLWTLYLPLLFLAQHEGGQNMSVPHNINNNFNAGGGLGVILGDRETLGLELDLSCLGLWYHQHGNATIPFSNGWAIYPELKVLSEHWYFMASYWHGKDFVPLLGSWHFSNLSANTEGLTFDRTRVITLCAQWKWQAMGFGYNTCSLHLYGTLYHYLPSTGTFADGTTKDYGHRNQFAVGARLSFYPTIKMH